MLPGGDRCLPALKAAALARASQHAWVLLVSPFTWGWAPEHAAAVRDALDLLWDDAGAEVVGFPAVGRHGEWRWPVRRLDEHAGRLAYSAYPTGYPGAKGPCAVGDTTSGTRAYRPGLLQRLLAGARADNASTFLVELDLLARRAGVSAYTCVFPPMHEEDYLRRAGLPAAFAAHHGIEEAEFTTTHRASNCAAHTETPAAGGLALPCTAADAARALSAVAKLWARHPGAWIGMDCVGSVSSGSEAGPCPLVPGALARFSLHVGAGAHRAAAASLGASSTDSTDGSTSVGAPSPRFCKDLGRAHPEFRVCRQASEALVLLCGPLGRGCLELAFRTANDAAEAERLPRVRVTQWGVAVWVPEAPWSSPRGRGPTDFFECGAGAESPSPAAEAADVWVLHCGPAALELHLRPGWRSLVLQRPWEQCAPAYRSMLEKVPAAAWTLLVSPLSWAWGPEQAWAAERALEHGRRCGAAVLGFPVVETTGAWRWPASLRRRFWKLEYRAAGPQLPGAARGCREAASTSGTRLYRPGLLRQLLASAGAPDAASLLVELDLLALERGLPALTCALPGSRERSFLAEARLSPSLAERHQLEAARFARENQQEHCLGTNGSHPWALAHALSDARLATRLCYRRRIEEQFCGLVSWWRRLAAGSHFASVKQGTLLTAMIRGGDVSMMPWDSDLELGLYSTGPNPVLGWCAGHPVWAARAQCVLERLQAELGLPCRPGPDFLSTWLFEEHLAFAKFRVEVAGVFDVSFEGWVPRMPIRVKMFGSAEVRVSWELWEQLFFEVFSGSLAKKVGTSGNIAAGVERCASEHNACLPPCVRPAAGGSCVLEFEDHLAHTRDPYGSLFPQPWLGMAALEA